jgi:transcriptional regulator with XRE-family HTH domain
LKDGNLASRLRWILRMRGWSQRKLSKKASLSAAHIGQILARAKKGGGESIETDTLTSIANAAGVSVDWLASGRGAPWIRDSSPRVNELPIWNDVVAILTDEYGYDRRAVETAGFTYRLEDARGNNTLPFEARDIADILATTLDRESEQASTENLIREVAQKEPVATEIEETVRRRPRFQVPPDQFDGIPVSDTNLDAAIKLAREISRSAAEGQIDQALARRLVDAVIRAVPMTQLVLEARSHDHVHPVVALRLAGELLSYGFMWGTAYLDDGSVDPDVRERRKREIGK